MTSPSGAFPGLGQVHGNPEAKRTGRPGVSVEKARGPGRTEKKQKIKKTCASCNQRRRLSSALPLSLPLSMQRPLFTSGRLRPNAFPDNGGRPVPAYCAGESPAGHAPGSAESSRAMHILVRVRLAPADGSLSAFPSLRFPVLAFAFMNCLIICLVTGICQPRRMFFPDEKIAAGRPPRCGLDLLFIRTGLCPQARWNYVSFFFRAVLEGLNPTTCLNTREK
jgi:hypothetical protein